MKLKSFTQTQSDTTIKTEVTFHTRLRWRKKKMYSKKEVTRFSDSSCGSFLNSCDEKHTKSCLVQIFKRVIHTLSQIMNQTGGDPDDLNPLTSLETWSGCDVGGSCGDLVHNQENNHDHISSSDSASLLQDGFLCVKVHDQTSLNPITSLIKVRLVSSI